MHSHHGYLPRGVIGVAHRLKATMESEGKQFTSAEEFATYLGDKVPEGLLESESGSVATLEAVELDTITEAKNGKKAEKASDVELEVQIRMSAAYDELDLSNLSLVSQVPRGAILSSPEVLQTLNLNGNSLTFVPKAFKVTEQTSDPSDHHRTPTTPISRVCAAASYRPREFAPF